MATEVIKLIRAGQTISAISRASNVVSVSLAAAYPNNNLKVGQSIVIDIGVGGTTSFNGTHIIASVTNQQNFTYAQTDIDETGTLGTSPVAGGDYTNLTDWEAGEARDLVAADEIAVAEGYADWTKLSDSLIASASWTVDATRYPIVRPASGEQGDGHSLSGFVISDSAAWGRTINISNWFTCRLDGLSVEHIGAGSGIYSATSNSSMHIKNCYVEGGSGSGEGGIRSQRNSIINCVVKSPAGSAYFCPNYYPSIIYNSLAVNSGVGFDTGGRADNSNEGSQLVNCCAYNNGTNWQVGTIYTANCSNNAASDGATNTPPGTNPLTVDIVASDFTDAANDDYSLSSNSQLIDQGATIAEVTTDIIGTARPQGGAYDIGAFERIILAGFTGDITSSASAGASVIATMSAVATFVSGGSAVDTLSTVAQAVASVLHNAQSASIQTGSQAVSATIQEGSQSAENHSSAVNTTAAIQENSQASENQSAAAHVSASLQTGAQGADAPGGGAAMLADVDALATGNSVVDAALLASAALVAGQAAGETWADTVNAFGDLQSTSAAGESVAGVSSGTQQGVVTEQQSAAGQLDGAAATAAQLSDSAQSSESINAASTLQVVSEFNSTASELFVTAIATLATLTGAASHTGALSSVVHAWSVLADASSTGDVFTAEVNSNQILVAMIQSVDSDVLITASAVSSASFTSGALAGSVFGNQLEVGFITIGAVTLQAMVTANAQLNPTVSLKPTLH